MSHLAAVPVMIVSAVLSIAAGAPPGEQQSSVAADTVQDPAAIHDVVVGTPDGDIVITLAPESAPQHVAVLRAALVDHREIAIRLDRIASDRYVQVAVPDVRGWAGLAHEHGPIGNVSGAVSVYDGTDADPTLLLVLADSPHLDRDYTPIGWMRDLGPALALASRPAAGDGVPEPPLEIGPLRIAGESAPSSQLIDRADTTPQVAAGAVGLVALLIASAVALLHRRLQARWVTALLLIAVLMGAFAVLAAALAAPDRGATSGLVILAVIVGVVRLMSRFEPPADRAG